MVVKSDEDGISSRRAIVVKLKALAFNAGRYFANVETNLLKAFVETICVMQVSLYGALNNS